MALGTGIAGLVCAAVIVIVGLAAARPPDEAGEPLPEFPTEGPYAYKVEYLGITCGHMTLESRLEEYQGRPAYHVIMTASNARFFNKIYRVDGQIDSWVDAETMTSLAYESNITERGDLEIRRYRVNRDKGTITAERKGKVTEIEYGGEAALDPLAYIFRARMLAGDPGSVFLLNMLTDDGVFETGTQVGKPKSFTTPDGKKMLLRVQPITVDGEMFSRRGEMVYWIDPGPTRHLYRASFDLPFGKLSAKYMGPADKSYDRRTEAEKIKLPDAEK